MLYYVLTRKHTYVHAHTPTHTHTTYTTFKLPSLHKLLTGFSNDGTVTSFLADGAVGIQEVLLEVDCKRL